MRWFFNTLAPAALAIALAAIGAMHAAGAKAQTTAQQTPPVTVTGEGAAGSLTVPSVDEAKTIINQTPGGVDLVPAEEYRDGRALSVKDMLDYVPGVFAQPKWGEDARLSIRGSGLSRNFHLRGISIFQDGVPFNNADGSGDLQEPDPLAYRYIEVYKGGNALQYGAATLGGAINFVTPTGYDYPRVLARAEYGSFDSHRLQVGSGAVLGNWDYFISPTWSKSNGYRDHSAFDNKRLNTNVGYRFGDSAETRFYFGYNYIDQEVASSVFKRAALNNSRAVAPINIFNDYKRDIESMRISNKTTFALGGFEVTAGAFATDRTLFHPIFQVIDQEVFTYGGFLKARTEGKIFGMQNRFLMGANAIDTYAHSKRFVNLRSARGARTYDAREDAYGIDVYGENQFFFLPQVALVTGVQLNHSERKAKDRFLADGNDSEGRAYNSVNPKVGLLWEVDPDTQVFANVSRSSEPPTFGDLNPTAAPGFANLEAQSAITAEVGSRGEASRFAWDVTFYRAWIKDELQIFVQPSGLSLTTNADKTIHQGVEAGGAVKVLKGLFTNETNSDDVTLRTSYTFSDFSFDGDPVFGDNDLPGAPKHYLRADLSYKHPVGFSIGPNIEWVPDSYYIDNANTRDTKPYMLFGLKSKMAFASGMSLFVDGRNLADTRYIANANIVAVATAANSNVYFPGDGRSVFGGVEYRW